MISVEFVFENKDKTHPITHVVVTVRANNRVEAQIFVDRDYPEDKWAQIESGIVEDDGTVSGIEESYPEPTVGNEKV